MPGLPDADVIVGGFPCQDVSCAGKRAGITGERSGLYRELVRTLRLVRPRYSIMENVAALLGDGLDVVLGDLAESGFDTEWDCVPAQALGACHERDRIWIVAERADMPREPMGNRGQPRIDRGMEPDFTDAASLGRGQGRPWRPADSFAGIRDEARRNAADPYGARLAFRAGLTRDAWEKLSPVERDSLGNGGQSIWPDEPALSGMDDGIPDWVDRVKSTGNTIIPQIPEIIGRTIMRSIQ